MMLRLGSCFVLLALYAGAGCIELTVEPTPGSGSGSCKTDDDCDGQPTRNAYGFREYNTVEIALYHTLGALPEPLFSHKFL